MDAVLFGAAVVAWELRRRVLSAMSDTEGPATSVGGGESGGDATRLLLERVQRDEGGRGIAPLCVAAAGEDGEADADVLRACADALLAPDIQEVAILTGFPCLLDFEVPTETDGPPGAVALAQALVARGKRVVVLTDEANADCLLATFAGSGIVGGGSLALESFPPENDWESFHRERWAELKRTVQAVLAIERPGPAADGRYYTMAKRDMTHLIAPLERLITEGERCQVSVGIGDGGNEVGMGKPKVYEAIVGEESTIPHKESIACRTAASHLIVTSVSNWGGYALAAAMGSLPSDEQARLAVSNMVQVGARDGISKREGAVMVDGMDWDVSRDVLRDLRTIARDGGLLLADATAASTGSATSSTSRARNAVSA